MESMDRIKMKFVPSLGGSPSASLIPDSAGNELKKRSKSLERQRSRPKTTEGRVRERKVPRHVEEFHPRGAA